MYQDDFKKPRPLPTKWMALESLIDCIFTTKTDVWWVKLCIYVGVVIWHQLQELWSVTMGDNDSWPNALPRNRQSRCVEGD